MCPVTTGASRFEYDSEQTGQLNEAAVVYTVVQSFAAYLERTDARRTREQGHCRSAEASVGEHVVRIATNR